MLEDPQLNLTPLIDVVLVVLIIFIIIAPMLELDEVQLAGANPQAADVATVQESPISIHVHEDNTVWFNKRPVTTDQLVLLLRAAHQRYPNTRPQLFHDRRAQFGTYQSVKNAVEIAGFNEIDVVLRPS